MDENIVASIKLGVSVILVAALVATVLSLTVIANSIMGSGQMTLQSGVDTISVQEYEKYNAKTVSGVDVVSALSLYKGRDIAIIIQTRVCRTAGHWGYNYGAMLGEIADITTGIATFESSTTKGSQYAIGMNQYDPDADLSGQTALTDFYMAAGDSNFTGALLYKNGMPQYNNDTLGIESTGDPEYILKSAKFTAYLIKDNTGGIIGIYFSQQ